MNHSISNYANRLAGKASSVWQNGKDEVRQAYNRTRFSHLSVQSPFSSRNSTIKALAAAALAVVSASFVALAATSVVGLPLAISLAGITGIAAISLLASSILKKKQGENASFSKPEGNSTEPKSVDTETKADVVEESEAEKSEAEESEVKENEAEKSEVKENEAEKSEVKENEAEKSEVKENEAEESEVKENEAEKSEAEESKAEESEAEESEVKENEAEESEVKESKVEESEVKESKAEEKIDNEPTSIHALPVEVQMHIASQLENIQDLKNISEVSRSWRAASEDQRLFEKAKQELFQKLGGKIEVKGNKIEPYLAAAEAVKIGRLDLIEALGGLLAVANLPVLDIGNKVGYTDYIDFITPEEMSAPVMRGIDSFGRPFIALRYELRHGLEPSNPAVITLFQRYRDNTQLWVSGSLSLDRIFRTGAVDVHAIDRLVRLIKHEPVGYLKMDGEEEQFRTLANGQSHIKLV